MSTPLPPGSTTATGLIMMSGSYRRAAGYLFQALDKKDLKLHFESPAIFLLSHSTELALKAWLVHCGKTLENIKNLGHDLVALRDEAAVCGLRIDGASVIKKYATGVSDLHLSDDGELLSELDRLQKYPIADLQAEFERHFQLLVSVTIPPYVLRYPQTGYRSIPNLNVIQAYCDIMLETIGVAVLPTSVKP